MMLMLMMTTTTVTTTTAATANKLQIVEIDIACFVTLSMERIRNWPMASSFQLWEQSITNKIIVCVGAHGCSQMGLADRYL